MVKLMVLIVAVALIGFIVWWFFGKHQEAAVAAKGDAHEQNVKVSVDGGYSPSTIVLKKGIPAQITFNRKDPSSCLEQVVFEDFGINDYLPQNQDHQVAIDTSKAGEFNYACGMNMFHGKVVIK
ncbi:cupredoxin domain-containing protein [Pediococcus siamensis]|uniref:cupredoxin domain-containing protein n=1 Tax=Pediococcus siamensis TaxID=381829 RepID=UPI00399FF256